MQRVCHTTIALLSTLGLSAVIRGDQPIFGVLGDLEGGPVSSMATSVSADGSIVVGTSYSSNGPEAFRWTAISGMIGLGALSSNPFHSEANAVSGDGHVVVGFSQALGPGPNPSSHSQPFRWDGGMSNLGDLVNATLEELHMVHRGMGSWLSVAARRNMDRKRLDGHLLTV